MDPFVTRSAQGNQVFFRIVAEQATWLIVMNLELTHAGARLAAPSISL
jgi:hypothetical protein